jgi:hypothetical protein
MDRLSTIKELEDFLYSDKVFSLEAYSSKMLFKEFEDEIQRLNKETDWIEIVGSYDSFLDHIMKLENDFSHIDGFQKKEVLNIALKQLDKSCTKVIDKNGVWKYCSDENYKAVIDIQNDKLNYLKDSFTIIGIYIEGLDNVDEFINGSYNLIEFGGTELSQIVETEEEKRTNKLKIALLYRLGVIDHLQKFDSLKNNDSALSRVLASFLGGDKKTYQPYISAAKNNPKSSSIQNDPLSKRLVEKADDILINSGVSLKDLES